MGLYAELFYAIIPALFHFAVLLSLHLHTFLMFKSCLINNYCAHYVEQFSPARSVANLFSWCNLYEVALSTLVLCN